MIGTIGNSAGDGVPVTSYNLDQNQAVFFVAPNNTGSRLSRQTFFMSPTSPDGDHVLTLTLRSNATSFALDYFSVMQYKSSPVTASVPAVPIAISTTTATENAANTAGSQSTGSRLHQPAVITGIILGAAGFLAVTIAVICMCVRRRRARRGPTADDYREVNRSMCLALMQYDSALNRFLADLEPSFPPAQTIAHDRALRDGLTERSLDSRDPPPAYSSLSEHTAGIPKP